MRIRITLYAEMLNVRFKESKIISILKQLHLLNITKSDISYDDVVQHGQSKYD